MPAEEHDYTSPYYVKPTSLLPEDSSESSARQPSLGASNGGTAHLHLLELMWERDCFLSFLLGMTWFAWCDL
uniref:Uncharacterized protein n=1 Tax=Nelumbo nucifera TaxID=4432 RepID=A0A822YLB0_NELNU|nr:TPA_asm: hypothetical protein HUJ06_010547 [Nelumbo nucifera]